MIYDTSDFKATKATKVTNKAFIFFIGIIALSANY